MKRKLIVIVALMMAILIVLPGCNNGNSSADPASEESTAAETDSTDTEVSKEVKITITPPEGWEPVEGSTVPVQYLKNTASFIVKNEDFFSSKDLDVVVEEAKAAFSDTFDNVQYLGDVETATIDGKDARILQFTCEVSGMSMKYKYAYLVADGVVYAITFGDLAATFDSLSADYDTILADIKFE